MKITHQLYLKAGATVKKKVRPICLRLNVSQKVLDESAGEWRTVTRQTRVSTGIEVLPSDWNAKQQRFKDGKGGADQARLTEFVEAARARAEKTFASGRIAAAADLKAQPAGTTKPEPVSPGERFFEVYQLFIDAQGQVLQPRTLANYHSTLLSLLDFSTSYPVSFEAVDLNFYEAYRGYLLNKQHRRSSVYKGLLNDTIAKHVSILKTFMDWALERKFHAKADYKSFKAPRKMKNDIVTLAEGELLQLYQFDLSDNNRLERVRDLFCFGCFTGQRWGDIHSFSAADVKEGTWRFESEKTKKKTIIPLVGFSETAAEILAKYGGELPKLSSQKFNDYLKEAGQLAGLNRKVDLKRYAGAKLVVISQPLWAYMSSHMARRTFVTILLEKGAPPTTLMKLTGHSDLRTLLKYENTSSEAVGDTLRQIGSITK